MLQRHLRNRLALSNKLYLDLVTHIPESLLASKLCDLLSNTIGEQLWCVVGARDSYLRAAQAGKWQGFKCPLDSDKTTVAKAVSDALTSTSAKVDSYLETNEAFSKEAIKFLLDLLEHEAQHHGQLARYLYGL
jgi:hypothetical protein